ncbi:TVG0963330 [Thermoplasma volcanium GSS1]|uniref:TVG0963330 protein n=1 Tax=Thermoplasma volcanium (strain ATCC 51530 / DSM 4299 / JCM 9571 / NBRC 15438 / GSS1) TaxID=273116 RepID=Q97A74_THEVO|nr:TVG0963330 [Thermoplasma volcanium GSS1]
MPCQHLAHNKKLIYLNILLTYISGSNSFSYTSRRENGVKNILWNDEIIID